MPKSSKPARRSAANPSARPAAAARTRERRRAPAEPSFSPAQVRARHDGWTPERQTRFLEALAESGCVTEAARAVGMSKQSAYGLRTRVDAQGFRMAWDAALDFGIRRLSDECYSRALHGEEIPHYYQGELVGTHRRYDNRLAMFLLRYRDPLRYAASLDQMVYSGHPEAAPLAFAKALNRAAEEAHGVADTPPAATDPAPWTTQPIADALKEASEQAIVEGDGPIHGSWERRKRLEERRRAHRKANPPRPQYAEMMEIDPRTIENDADRKWHEYMQDQLEKEGMHNPWKQRAREQSAQMARDLGEEPAGGDVPSTSSTSDPLSDPPEPLSKTDNAAWIAYRAQCEAARAARAAAAAAAMAAATPKATPTPTPTPIHAPPRLREL